MNPLAFQRAYHPGYPTYEALRKPVN